MWDTCETWRLRLPSAHDSMLHWATIVHWRSIIYDFMIHHFMPLEQTNANLYSLGFRDKSRSVNIMARAARKHGLPMLANHVINTMYRYPTMEVSEAFTKIQEQCKAYVDAKDHQVRSHPESVHEELARGQACSCTASHTRSVRSPRGIFHTSRLAQWRVW